MSKARIIKLLNILQTQTSVEHIMNAQQLIDALEAEGEKAERKAIYDDIRSLREAGYYIEYVQENGIAGYYYDSFLFEKSELRAIVEALNACNYITDEKTNELIEKLLTLTNEAYGKDIAASTRYRHPKTTNKKIFYNIDAIGEAILHEQGISFLYFDYSLKNEKIYRKSGKRYLIKPYFTVQNNDRLYVIAYSLQDQQIRHYRVDRMEDVREEPCEVQVNIDDVNNYVGQHFEMFAGPATTVRMRCKNALSGEIVDKFGETAIVSSKGEDYFEFSAKISESPTFYSWVYKLGGNVEILDPQSVIDNFVGYTKEILKRYE